jgi:hypothetical protein
VILSLFRSLFEFGFGATAAFLFLSLTLAIEVGYRLGRLRVGKRLANSAETPSISTLTAAMLGLLAFTLSLSINFAQNRYEERRGLVMQEANAIGTAWLRAKLIDGDESSAVAAKIEDYARARLAFTIAASDADALPLVTRAEALQNDIWRTMQVVARRSPNPVTTALINALNDMFDHAASQRFAYQSGVPADLVLALFFGALLTIGSLGYQFGVAGKRQEVMSLLLLLMWSGGILLIVDLSKPRVGDIHAEAEPLVWAIQGFDQK